MQTEHTLVEFAFAYYPKGTKVIRSRLTSGVSGFALDGWSASLEEVLNAVPQEKEPLPPNLYSSIEALRGFKIEYPDSEFSEDVFCLLGYEIVSGTDGYYGSNLEADIDNSTLGDTLAADDVFALVKEEIESLKSPKPVEKLPNETFGELFQRREATEALFKQIPIILRILTIWKYSTWRDSYTGEYDCECSLVRTVTMDEIMAALKKNG